KLTQTDLKKTGIHIKPSLGLCNLYQLLYKEEDEEVTEIFTLGSYIINCLTGNNICHITNAAALGLTDIIEKDWDKKLIDRLGFNKLTFPVIAKSDFEVCGLYQINNQTIKVYPDYGDQQTSILGRLVNYDDVVLNIATASQVSKITKNYKRRVYETRPYFSNTFINTVSNLPSGRNIDVFIEFILDTIKKTTEVEIPYELVWENIKKNYQPKMKHSLEFEMDFFNHIEESEKGYIKNINQGNFTFNNLISAAFMNMAKKYDEAINILIDKESTIRKMVCSGGVSWNVPQLLDVVSEITGYEYCFSQIPDEIFLGFYRIALICEGICNDLDSSNQKALKMLDVWRDENVKK